MPVAEITVPSISLTAVGVTAQSWGDPGSKVVVTPAGHVYVFYIGSDSDFWYIKSVNGGVSFEEPVSIYVGTCVGFSVWFDQWTPDGSGGYQTGSLIHLAYWSGATDVVLYRTIDTADDSFGTQQTVFTGVTLVGSANTCISLTKTRGGNLLCMFDCDGGTEKGLYRSTDGGANWTARTDPTEGADYFMILPGYAADNQDAIIIFWDRSALTISRKNYDDSADSTDETATLGNAGAQTSIASTTCSPQFAAVPLPSELCVIYWSNRDAANSFLLHYGVTETSVSSAHVLVTSTDDQQCCAISYSPRLGMLRAYYHGKTDGSETVATAIGVYYRDSYNNGVNWSAEQTFSNRPITRISMYAPLIVPGKKFCALTGLGTSAGQNLYVEVEPASARPYLQVGL